MQRVKLGLVCLSWICLTGAAFAQSAANPISTVDPTSSTGAASVTLPSTGGSTVVSGGGIFDGTYLDVRHVIGDGVGYINSYSQVGGFLPIWMTEDFMVAPNARMIITNSTQTGVNAGLVGRQYLSGLDRILGVYGYYDNDQDSYNNRYSQFTVGAETLGQWWDLRANGYLLNGTQNNFLAPLCVTGSPYYAGNNIVFQGQQLRDQALGGADAEFGMPLTPYTPWLRGYAGIYGYHTNQGGNTIGWRSRLEANVANDLTLGMTVSNDELYGTNINGTVEFRFSGFKPTTYFPNMTTRQRMVSSVQRNWRVATHTYIQDINIAANNPNTSQPYFITFVNNAAAPGGNGTFEHPYTSLPSTAPGNIILVEQGNSSATNPVTGSIALANNQILLGAGFPYPISLNAQYGSCNVNGTYTLPGTSSSNPYPFVGGTPGNIVTLANNNEVAGLSFINAGGNAITNTAAGSNNFYLHDLNIAQSGGQGISLTNASGSGVIANINADTALNPTNGGLGNNHGGGIQIASGGSGLNLLLSNVYMNSSNPANQLFGISLTADNAPLNVNMNNVYTSGNGDGGGIVLSENNQTLFAGFNVNPDGTPNNTTYVTTNNNSGPGIQLQGTGGSLIVAGAGVTASNNGSNNLQIGTQLDPITNASVNVALYNSNFNGSTGGSGIVYSQSGGSGNLNFINSNSMGNAQYGLGFFGSNSTQMNAIVTNGTFSNNFDAFHVEGTTGSSQLLIVDPTDASNSVRNGLYFNLDGANTVLNTGFFNDNLNNSGGSAVYGNMTNTASMNVQFINTTASGSGGDGLYLNAATGSTGNITVNNGTFSNSGVLTPNSSAYNVNLDNSIVNLTTVSTPANNFNSFGVVGTQAFGLTLNTANNAIFNGTFINGDFSNTLTNAVNFNVQSGSNATVNLSGTSGNNSGADGINGTVTGASSVAIVNIGDASTGSGTVNSTFDNSGVNGMNFNVNAGVLAVNAMNSSFSYSGAAGAEGSGVLGTVTNNGWAYLNFTNTAVNNNLDNGVFVTTNTGGNINAAFSSGSASFNGNAALTSRRNDGIRLDMTGLTYSSLSLTNGTTVNSNGNDGVAIIASGSTNFNGNFDTIQVLNNGVAPTAGAPYTPTGAGFDVLTQTNSNVNLNFNAVTSGNSAGSTTQQIGFLANTFTSGQLSATVTNSNFMRNTVGFQSDTETSGLMVASFTGTTLSNNVTDAVSTTVNGAGSVADVTFNATTGDNNGSVGAFFNVTNGGSLNVTATNSTSFSNNGSDGMLVAVDGANSQAAFDLTPITLMNNGTSGFGGLGFNGQVTNGGALYTAIINSTINANGLQGIGLNVDGANSLAVFQVTGTTVDANRSEGLLINATNGGDVNYRSENNSYSNNGSNGGLDGVKLAADNATILTLFSGDTINANAGNGFSLLASNGATLTTSLNNVTITNNGGYGIFSSATGPGTSFNLLMTGTNTISGNTLGSYNPFVFNNIGQAVIEISGSSNNSSTDGIAATFTNMTNAAFALTGPGTYDNNADNGINVTMTNVTNGSVLINGVTEINNNGQNGILVSFDNVTNGAIGIVGPTTANGNHKDAVNIQLLDSNLIDGLTFGPTSLTVLTLTDNLPPLSPPLNPLSNTLPIPVNETLDSLGLAPTTALTISGIASNISGDTGINITANTSAATSSIQTLSVTNNQIANASGTTAGTGDGIYFNLTNTPVTTLNVTGNSVGGAKLNGVNFDLNNSPIATLNIANNNVGVIGGNLAAVADTAPVIVTFAGYNANTLAANDDGSTGSVSLGFNMNFFGVNENSLFVNNNGNVTFGGPLGAFTPFSLLSNSIAMIAPFFADVDTRFGGNPVTYGTGTIGGFQAFAVNWLGVDFYNTGSLASPTTDTFQLVLISRPDLGAGDFQMEFNYQQVAWETGTASGGSSTGLGGSSARAGYSNGIATSYEFPGSAVNGALLDGGPAATSLIHNSLNSSVLGRYNFFGINGLVTGPLGNGGDGIRLNATNGSNIGAFNATSNVVSNNAKNGIEMLISNSDVTNPTFTGNTVNNNAGDGIRMVNPITLATTITPTFNGNTISNNGGTGVNLNLVAGTQDLQASFTNNTINSNVGGPGVNIQLADNHNVLAGSDFTHNTINSNGAQGVNFSLGLNGNVNSNFTNNTISSNGTNILINTNAGQGVNYAMGLNGNVTGDYTGNTISNNFNQGVNFAMSGGGGVTGNFTNNTVNANGGVGLDFAISGNGNVTGNFIGNTVNNNKGQGIYFNFNQFLAGNLLSDIIGGNTVSNNLLEGIRIDLGTGGSFVGNTTAANDFYGNTISNNGSLGVRLTSPDNSTFDWNLGDATQAANTISGNVNAGVGITMSVTGASLGTLNVVNTNITNTTAVGSDFQSFNGEGLAVMQQGSSVLSGSIASSSFTGNASDGAFFSVVGLSLSTFAELNTFTVNTSVFNTNGNNGLEFYRGGYGQIGTSSAAPIVIENSTFNGNGTKIVNTLGIGRPDTNFAPPVTQGNGIELTATGATSVVTIDNYSINGNTISQNSGNGLMLYLVGQAELNVNMNVDSSTTNANLITFNGLNGIQLTEHVGSTTADNRALTGTWRQNTITNNKGDGIALDGETQSLTIGDATNAAFGNTISQNGLNGIENSGRSGVNGLTGALTISNNVITFNGTLANLGTVETTTNVDKQNAGILLDVGPVLNNITGGTEAIDSYVIVSHNSINNNFGDGIDYGISNTIAGLPTGQSQVFFTPVEALVQIDTNTIDNNSGRGINIINRSANTTYADVSNNIVSGNLLEGIYVINTSDSQQFQASYNNSQLTALYASGKAPLTANGASGGAGTAGADANLQIRIVGNQILGNGTNSGLGGTGLVMAIGTTGGGYGPTNPGGFASSGSPMAANASFATFLSTAGLTFNGGVVAQVDSNHITGNLGNDVAFQSFVSTVAPSVAGVTYTSPNPNPAFTSPYDGDPLSRFDLYFRNNTVDINSVTSQPLIDSLGQSFTNKTDNQNGYNEGYGAIAQSLLAFYNNADPVKSNQAVNPPTFNSGPFGTSDTRARNATRLAANIAPYNVPAGLTGNLYSGLGASTWRISTDSTAIINLAGPNYSPSLIDTTNNPTNVFQENGIIQTIADNQNGQTPFGWGTF